VTEGKINLNLVQARKLADLLNKAEWHSSRGGAKAANDYLQQALEILKGVRRPVDDTAVRRLYDLLTDAERTKITVFGKLRSSSIEALEEVEKSLYVPMARGEAVR